MGVIGAVAASGFGQTLSVAVLLMHFLRRKGTLHIGAFKLEILLAQKICRRGVPEAMTQLTMPVTALCFPA